MPLMNATTSRLVVIDVQERLMPAIEGGEQVLANIRRLMEGAALLSVPRLLTEQNPRGLGGTVPELAQGAPVVTKMSFDCCGAPQFMQAVAGDEELVLCGCEAHVCVGQTVLTLLGQGRRVAVVRDAVGSRRAESKEAALRRFERHGAEIVTTEMVLFEWLRSAEHPQFRALAKLIR